MEFKISDLEALFRPLKAGEIERASALIPVVFDSLRMAGKKAGKDLDQMVKDGEIYESVLKSVIADVIGRTLMTSTDTEPMTQFSESALGYSASGTFLVPGGGLFIKDTELKRLGLWHRQQIRGIELYD